MVFPMPTCLLMHLSNIFVTTVYFSPVIAAVPWLWPKACYLAFAILFGVFFFFFRYLNRFVMLAPDVPILHTVF